jgi:predicted hydrocarbon binding protein
MSDRGKIRGGTLLSRLAFVRGRSGETGVRAVLAALPEADRAIFDQIVLPIGWYPFETSERLDAEIAKRYGGNAIYRTLGAESASSALTTTHKNFVRARDPHGLLKHVAQLHRLYKDTGYMTYEWVDASCAVLRTFECASWSITECLTNLGWHEQAIELCGGKNVRAVETRCRSRGDAICEYTCRWELAPPPSMRPPR